MGVFNPLNGLGQEIYDGEDGSQAFLLRSSAASSKSAPTSWRLVLFELDDEGQTVNIWEKHWDGDEIGELLERIPDRTPDAFTKRVADLINDGKAYLPSSSSSSTARKLVLPGNSSYREFTVSMTPILKKDFMSTLATSNRELVRENQRLRQVIFKSAQQAPPPHKTASLAPPPDTSSQILASSSQATSRTVDSAAEATARHYKELLENERLERQKVERRLKESMDSKGQSPSKLPGFDSHIKRKGESRAQPGYQDIRKSKAPDFDYDTDDDKEASKSRTDGEGDDNDGPDFHPRGKSKFVPREDSETNSELEQQSYVPSKAKAKSAPSKPLKSASSVQHRAPPPVPSGLWKKQKPMKAIFDESSGSEGKPEATPPKKSFESPVKKRRKLTKPSPTPSVKSSATETETESD